jgi:hypothetical protein
VIKLRVCYKATTCSTTRILQEQPSSRQLYESGRWRYMPNHYRFLVSSKLAITQSCTYPVLHRLFQGTLKRIYSVFLYCCVGVRSGGFCPSCIKFLPIFLKLTGHPFLN